MEHRTYSVSIARPNEFKASGGRSYSVTLVWMDTEQRAQLGQKLEALKTAGKLAEWSIRENEAGVAFGEYLLQLNRMISR